MLEVDASGKVQRSLGDKPALSGKDLVLTIDLDLQRAAEEALSEKSSGAMIALDPNTGAILAMASKPNFDPNFLDLQQNCQIAQLDNEMFQNTSINHLLLFYYNHRYLF